MNAELLLEHFHRLGDAPDAVPRLRRFILDLAVRGKLVEQNATDEPADRLLKLIEQEKRQTAKQYRVKQEVLAPPNADEFSFSVPPNWALTRLASIAMCLDHMREPINSTERGKRIEGKLESDLYPYYGATQQQGLIDSYLFNEELVLLGEDGVPFFDDLRPKAYMVNGKCWVNNHAHVFSVMQASSSFILHSLNTFNYQGRVVGATRGKLNKSKAVDIPIALPPLAEQQRIVAKVDELMALCDTLDAAQQQREQQRTQLTAATWQAVTEEGTPGQATNAARFALEQLPALTTRPEQVKALRQTILDLAVRGKLVEQDAKDGTASVLLKKIAAEKARLVKEGIMKPERKQRGHTEEGILLKALPQGWAMTTLGALAQKITDGAHQTPTYVPTGIPFISVKDFSGGKLKFGGTRFITQEEHTVLYERCDPRRGDILIGRIGTIGKPVIVDTDVEFSLFVSVGLMRFGQEHLSIQYIKILLDSPLVAGEYDRIKIGGATHTNKLNLGDLHTIAFPLPPLAEQGRIVAKVDALMALCDGLEAALREGEEVKGKALEAVLRSDDQTIRRSDTSTPLSAGNGVAATTLAPKRVKAKLPAYEEPEEELALAAEPVGTYAVQALVRRGRGRPPKDASLTTTAERAIGEYLKEHSGWHAKSEVLAATGLDAWHWNAAIKALLEGGQVERMGEKKGARYRSVSVSLT